MTTALSASLRVRAIDLTTNVLRNQSQWYVAGTWTNPLMDQWVYTSSGFAGLCGSLSRATGDPKALALCVESYNYAIDNLSHPANYFADVGNTATALERFLFASELAWVLYIIGDKLAPSTRSKWLNALRGNIENLEATSNFLWWSNGNWIACGIRLLYLAAQAFKSAGDVATYERYNALYERQYAFLLNPAATDAKWKGYGLTVDVTGGQTDWSDYQAHLTEVRGGPPMPNAGAGSSWNDQPPFGTFDGDYTGLTLEHLAQWYVASRDVRALRLLNAIANKFFSLVDATTWLGNFGNGSRHNAPSQPIVQEALPVLALLGERMTQGGVFTDAKVLDNWDKSMVSIVNGYPTGAYGIPYSRSIDMMLGTTLLATELAQPKL